MSIIPSKFFMDLSNNNTLVYIGLLIISFMVGIIVTVANIALGALFNEVVPIEAMGRASSVFNLAVTVFIPIGQMIFGYLYDTMIPSIGIGLSGIIMLVVVMKYRSALIGYDEGEAEILVEGDIIDEF